MAVPTAGRGSPVREVEAKALVAGAWVAVAGLAPAAEEVEAREAAGATALEVATRAEAMPVEAVEMVLVHLAAPAEEGRGEAVLRAAVQMGEVGMVVARLEEVGWELAAREGVALEEEAVEVVAAWPEALLVMVK